MNDEKAELIHELSQKNRSVQEAEVAIADCRAEQEKYQKSAKEIIEELRSQYVEAMQEQATVGNELKYLERQYQQESAKIKQPLRSRQNCRQRSKEKRQPQKSLMNACKPCSNSWTNSGSNISITRESQREQKKNLMMHRKNVSVNEPSPTSAGKTTEFTGYPRKLCWLLSRRQTSSKNKQQLTGVVGAVAELIEVPEEYTVAIETALGASAQ